MSERARRAVEHNRRHASVDDLVATPKGDVGRGSSSTRRSRAASLRISGAPITRAPWSPNAAVQSAAANRQPSKWHCTISNPAATHAVCSRTVRASSVAGRWSAEAEHDLGLDAGLHERGEVEHAVPVGCPVDSAVPDRSPHGLPHVVAGPERAVRESDLPAERRPSPRSSPLGDRVQRVVGADVEARDRLGQQRQRLAMHPRPGAGDRRSSPRPRRDRNGCGPRSPTLARRGRSRRQAHRRHRSVARSAGVRGGVGLRGRAGRRQRHERGAAARRGGGDPPQGAARSTSSARSQTMTSQRHSCRRASTHSAASMPS